MYLLNEFAVSVGLTDTAVLPANDTRVGLVISSPEANRVSLSFAGAAVLGNGLTLNPGGDPVVLTPGVWG